MKFNKKLLLALAPSILTLGVLGGFTFYKLSSKVNVGKDTAIYDHDLSHASVTNPDIVNGRYVREAGDEEEE